MNRDNRLETLKAMLDGAKAGEFWIGSTSAGRHRIDRAATLEEILEAAVVLEEATVASSGAAA